LKKSSRAASGFVFHGFGFSGSSKLKLKMSGSWALASCLHSVFWLRAVVYLWSAAILVVNINKLQMFKVIVVGNSNVGKTSIVNRFIGDKFDPNYKATVAADFSTKILEIKGNEIRL
jgi:hypothetical protein